MPNAYNGANGHSLLEVKNVVVQMIDGNGYYIASADCEYGTYVWDRTHDATLPLKEGDVISLWGKVDVYYGLEELASILRVRRESPR